MDAKIRFSYAGSYRETWFHDIHIASHVHSGTELVLVTRGECVSEFSSGELLRGSEDDIFIIPPGIRHDQRGRCITLYMEFDLPEPMIPGKVQITNIGNDPHLQSWMKSLLELGEKDRPPETHPLAAAVWTRLSSHLEAREQNLPVYVHRAQDFIREHYSNSRILAEEIASAAGCCVSHLDMLFRKNHGCSMMRWLYSYRMERARVMLENPYYFLDEIAEACGFSSSNYFIRAFRKVHGKPPGEFRRRKSSESRP